MMTWAVSLFSHLNPEQPLMKVTSRSPSRAVRRQLATSFRLTPSDLSVTGSQPARGSASEGRWISPRHTIRIAEWHGCCLLAILDKIRDVGRLEFRTQSKCD